VTSKHEDWDLKLDLFVRFEVFIAMTMKNGVFWDVTPCDVWCASVASYS
jgi:hypothetical protein